MKIQVLGLGCPTCKKLFELTKEAVKQLSLKEEVEYITDASKIIEMGVMSSPVLVVNGKPVMTGLVPDIEKIKRLLSTSTTSEDQSVQCDCKDDDDCDGKSKPNKASNCSCGGKYC
ncbi:MAG: thioredoxin family protein [Candidatus Roizmanbacteria bacterium]|nr:thioredoxin family protein [Candidatus Roizmanbacteria bacterium]